MTAIGDGVFVFVIFLGSSHEMSGFCECTGQPVCVS